MNQYPAGAQAPPAMPFHPGRRQNDFNYPSRQSRTPPQHMPYPNYHSPQYHGPPPLSYGQQWYQPYPQFPPPPSQQFQPRSPLVVSSQPHGQSSGQYARPSVYTPAQTPQPVTTPQPEQSTPSTASQNIASPDTPSTSLNTSTPPASVSLGPALMATVQPPSKRMPFYPELPWYSKPDSDFPPRAPRMRRKRRALQTPTSSLELPIRRQSEETDKEYSTVYPSQSMDLPPAVALGPLAAVERSRIAEPTNPLLSESMLKHGAPQKQSIKPHARNPTMPVIPIVPITPRPTSQRVTSTESQSIPIATSSADDPPLAEENFVISDAPQVSEQKPEPPPLSAKLPAPKSWADLVRSQQPAANAAAGQTATVSGVANGLPVNKAGSLSDALQSYTVESNGKISFLEPRGLVNTGNMCYMNSILQILVFCVPFYEFLDQVGKRAVHSFKSDTPLIEAMIMFMREFNIIDSAVSVQQLRMRLKDSELEQYGEAFIPEYVYDVIRKLPRFSSMRRGHQQDAEEFLGFLLEGLHDECVQVMRSLGSEQSPALIQSPQDSSKPTSPSADSGWLEVGPKQKPSITRSSGIIVTDSPITKIFGGNLRSELRVPGLKNSVTLEPYQPLQLDIGAPDIVNISDALKGLTRSETLHGEFHSPRGPGVKAAKQVFIETLPSVLILHLKRFQYDNTGGTQKIWKRIGYPLELEIPKEVFPPNKRGQMVLRPGGMPTYRLIGVVYHHGKNASGGHYTVDVRRQDGREWIRLDDTVIRRVRSEDVAGEGGEEDPRVLAVALENHKRDQSAGKNIFSRFGEGEEDDEQQTGENAGWSQVNGSSATSPTTATTKKWSSIANGTTGTETPSTAGMKTPKDRYSLKDNKVAYILFYQRIGT